MDTPGEVAQNDRRSSGRQALGEQVIVVEFAPESLVGPGQNLSEEGVFFVAEGTLRVQVRVGDDEWVAGEVVRTQSMGDGKIGIAVKFC